jgi:hypothetical protein
LSVLLGSKASRLVPPVAPKAAEVLGITYIGVWASGSHNNCCRHGVTKSLGSRSSEAPEGYSSSAASTGESSLWVAGALGPDFLHGLQRAQFSGAAADLGKSSLWAAGVLGPDFLHRLQGAQFCGAAAMGTELAGLCLL